MSFAPPTDEPGVLEALQSTITTALNKPILECNRYASYLAGGLIVFEGGWLPLGQLSRLAGIGPYTDHTAPAITLNPHISHALGRRLSW